MDDIWFLILKWRWEFMKRDRRERVSRELEAIFEKTYLDLARLSYDCSSWEIWRKSGDVEWKVVCLEVTVDENMGSWFVRFMNYRQFFRGKKIYVEKVLIKL